MDRRTRTGKRGLAVWARCGLILALVCLYAASGDDPLWLDGVTASVLVLEAMDPAAPGDLASAGDVLQERVHAWYPQVEARLIWTVRRGDAGDVVIATVPPGVPPTWFVAEAARIGLVELIEGGTEFLPIGRHVESGPVPHPELGTYRSVLTARHFVSAEARLRNGKPVIDFVLTPEGWARLADHTGRQRGYYLCLVVDGEVVTCPILRTPLADGRGLIELTGKATLEQARLLAGLLRSGPLPLTLRLADQTVSY